jgi:hypothetical protein
MGTDSIKDEMHNTVEALKPDQSDTKITQPKKTHRLRNWVIAIVVIIIVLAIALSVTGVYAVPGVAAIFGTNHPKDLGIKVSDQAFTELQHKVPLVVSDERADYSGSATGAFSGEVAVDTQNTSEEITSWLARRAGSNSPVTDIQVRMIEGGVEVSGMVNQYIHAPVYARAMITRTGEQSVAISITSAKVGIFSVPQKYLDQAEKWFNDNVNSRMSRTPGFSLTQLEYHDGYDIFKGTLPATAKQPTGGWADLFTK